MITQSEPTIKMVPIAQINIPNHRLRGQKKFTEIVQSIRNLGLKRPITVVPCDGRNGDPHYELVCGEGRLEACKAIEAEEVAAVVIAASKEDLLLMSLVENLARKRHTSIDLAKNIAAMKERGYDCGEIAKKVALDVTYVRGIIRLLNKGEERLLKAVEEGHIPISIAITIACSDDQAVQRALTDAYENKNLRGKALLRARRLIELRRTRGKALRSTTPQKNGDEMSAEKLLKTYQQETARQQIVVRKAKLCETRLLFVVSALKSLFQDENFVTLLRAEAIASLPQYLADQINGKAG